jgi:hypothetical protein
MQNLSSGWRCHDASGYEKLRHSASDFGVNKGFTFGLEKQVGARKIQRCSFFRPFVKNGKKRIFCRQKERGRKSGKDDSRGVKKRQGFQGGVPSGDANVFLRRRPSRQNPKIFSAEKRRPRGSVMAVFYAGGRKIFRGFFLPSCRARREKKTVEKAMAIAEKNGGKIRPETPRFLTEKSGGNRKGRGRKTGGKNIMPLRRNAGLFRARESYARYIYYWTKEKGASHGGALHFSKESQ